MKIVNSRETAVTLLPPYRASSLTSVQVRLWAPEASNCRWTILSSGTPLRSTDIPSKDGAFEVVDEPIPEVGSLVFQFEFFNGDGVPLASHSLPYEVVESGVQSTRRVDGCWVSIAHWSEDEARHFNTDLKKLSHEDWKDQIRAMNAVGIKSVLIQNVFDCNEYAGQHGMTPETYTGRALYPSPTFSNRYPISCHDPVRAILEAADECGMTVLLGVGLFAWFDFGAKSLEWHRQVTGELFALYGHHPSLYGWYISEEMFGSLYDEWEHLPAEKYKDIVHFFKEYKAFVEELTPTKPVALAPNNIRFHEFAEEWGEILPYIDILIPFAFARDLQNLNIAEIKAICARAKTRFWVDMEMFSYPLDNGLVPKSIDELLSEIRIYDDVEQIFGYQFTGIMNAPESPHNLGGAASKQLYADYYNHLIQERAPIHSSS
ncbi:MAG TPA: DUF4434 domain-containing protein [Fimbriimonas sp.]|nr:DUF4434 domain-containing protein [Fimbriimonas sp.]